MQWLSPKIDNAHDNVNQDDFTNDDLEQELLDLLKENPSHTTVPHTTLSSTQGKTNYDEDELLLAQLVESMENDNQPLSGGGGGSGGAGGSDELDMMGINAKDFLNDDDKKNTSDSPHQKTELTTNDVSGSNMSSINPPSSGNNLKSVGNDNTIVKADKQPPLDVRQAVLDYINPKTTPSGLDLLKNRHKEYKLAALKARDDGELGKAKELLEASKCIGEAIVNIEAGKETFDPETDLPPPPSEYEFSGADEENSSGAVAAPPAPPPPTEVKQTVPDIMKTPVICSENILARIAYYKEKIKQIGDDPSQDSKRRRYNRILNRYEEGLRACENGYISFEFEELVPPPGYPALNDRSKITKGEKSTGNESNKAAALSKPSSGQVSGKSKSVAIVTLLTKRQNELKEAAKLAKQSGNIELAKKYIRSFLGMNQMIQAAEAGFPIDLSQLPRSPTTNESAAYKPILSGSNCEPPVKYAVALKTSSGDHLVQVYSEILSEQEKLVSHLLTEHRRNGDQSVISKLSDLMSVNTCIKKVLSKHSHQVGILTPYFESANLPKLNINAELGDDVLEVTVLRGIAYPLPSHYSHIDTYVDVELCISTSSPSMKLSTNIAKSSCEPVYTQSVKEFRVNTKGRIYKRFVQSNRCLKATVYYNRGIFRSWGVLGVTEIPLTGLVQSATVTHIGDLKEGRKVVGGRLEVQLRQRESLSGEAVVYEERPWLLLSVPKQQNDSPKTMKAVSEQHNSPASSSSSASSRTIVIKRDQIIRS